VCLARNTGPSGSALHQEDFLGLFPINPLPLARYRTAFPPSRAKDDPTDAALQVERLLTPRDKRAPLAPPSSPMRALAPLVKHRWRLVGDTVRRTHRLTSTLKNYVPHVLHWFQEKDPGLFCDVRRHWPTLTAVPLARRTPLERFFRAPHVRSADVMQTRIAASQSAVALTTDAGVLTPNALLEQALVAQLRVPLQASDDFDTASAQCAQDHPDFPVLNTWPGAVFAPRLRVAVGEQRERYASAADLQTYAGMAPVTERRGKKSWGHWRCQWPTCLRQPCVAWAAESTRQAFWAQIYSPHHRDKGKAHQAAVRALAFTWIRRLSRCWQERTPYDASTYLQALTRRGSSLSQNWAKAS
jgi:Transposase